MSSRSSLNRSDQNQHAPLNPSQQPPAAQQPMPPTLPTSPTLPTLPSMAATTQTYRVVVPHGVVGGTTFIVQAGGQQFPIICPLEARPGSVVEVNLPVHL